MSSADFREILLKGDAGKADRLVRAAVSAFCSLTRPSRREIAQLEDLVLPLYPMVSRETKRFLAAALCESDLPPPRLTLRLAAEPVDVAAPVLIRSPALVDADLVALIAEHGIAHARAIGRRAQLNPAVTQLIRALEASLQPPVDVPATTPAIAAAPDQLAAPPVAGEADRVRERLREMMRTQNDVAGAQTEAASKAKRAPFLALRDAAFTGSRRLFQTALADALGLQFSAARTIVELTSYAPLLTGLRSLDFSEEQAFMIAVAVHPRQFTHPEAIRLFLERYRLIEPETARERVRGWKLEMVSQWINRSMAGSRAASASPSAAFRTAR